MPMGISKVSVARLLFVLLAFYTILMTAWVGDDIQITFRQVWNFINGDGITFNYGERVQAFTHPLWFLTLSAVAALTNELFLTSMLVCAVFSVAAITLLMKVEAVANENTTPIVTPLYALIFSWAFVDYSTSGLENALSYFLIGTLLCLISSKNHENRIHWTYLTLALLVLNRMDYAILFLPLAMVLIPMTRTAKGFLRAVWPGALALVTWFLFSTFYFGSPFPNTFYAKLNADYPIDEVLERGRWYFLSLRLDHVSTLIILCGLILSLVSLSRILAALAIGQTFYLVYILFIGGDFMQGRFFAVPVFLAMGQIVIAYASVFKKFGKFSKIPVLAFLLTAAAIGFVTGFPFLTGTDYQPRKSVARIVDERGQYYQKFGLFSATRTTWPAIADLPDSPLDSYRTSCQFIGGYSLLDPSYHLIDVCALSDPFLSKLPAVNNGHWLIGHHIRKMPTEYGEYLIGRTDELPDKKLNSLLNDVNLAARGELYAFERFGAILRLNSGFHSDLDLSDYRNPDIFIPKTNRVESIPVKNWDNVLEYEKLPRILKGGKFMRFNNNVRFVSEKPRFADGLKLNIGATHVYDVFVNGKKIASTGLMDDNTQAGFVQMQTIRFAESMLVESVTLKAVGQLHRFWSNFNSISHFSLIIDNK